jgi:predicted Zn-dependent peptidase
MRHSVKEISLKNGAKGLLIHIPSASVMTMDFNFRAGEYLVSADKWEVPHLMEHVLLGANELIPRARDFQAELEKNGAYSNATTGVYDITYEAECADFEWDRVLDLLTIAITKPLFLEEEFQSEFGNVREEMAARSNNHFRRLSLEMRQALGLIAKTDAERLEIMSNVTVDDVREHYKKTHNTHNMRFVIAGNLTPGRVTTETLYSKILGTARERGLVYGMNSGLSQTRDASNWWFGAQVSDRNAAALLKIIIEELSKVLTGHIADQEIESTKQYALGRFQRSAQTVGGTASGYAGRYFFDGVIEDYYRVPERIKAITKEQIISISNAMFTDDVWGLGVLGNCGKDFTDKLQETLSPLWDGLPVVPKQLSLPQEKVVSSGRAV